MSWAAPADERPADPALIRAMLRRRKSTPTLYWRLKRPRAHVYAGAAAKVIIYRLAAAIPAILALTVFAFLGSVAGAIGDPRWPALQSIHSGAVKAAAAHATAELSRWAPVFVTLGLILVIIPRPRRWFFGITMLSGGALGYFQRLLPPFPRSTLAGYITERAASLINRITLPVSTSSIAAAVLSLAVVALAGLILYQIAYGLAVRTTGFMPSRPVSNYRSTFRAVNAARRLLAVLITAALLAVTFWIAANIRVLLDISHHGAFLVMHTPLSPAGCLLVTVAIAVAICAPRPQGHHWLLVVLLIAAAAYMFLPYPSVAPVPGGLLAGPGSFWLLAIGYLLVAGLAFDLVAALLDWPT